MSDMPPNVWSETDWGGYCQVCDEECHWVQCPQGGWWAHQSHPDDHHDADLGWQPEESMNDYGEYITAGAFVRGTEAR